MGAEAGAVAEAEAEAEAGMAVGAVVGRDAAEQRQRRQAGKTDKERQMRVGERGKPGGAGRGEAGMGMG